MVVTEMARQNRESQAALPLPEKQAEPVVIPLDAAPELKYLGRGKTAGLRVLGIVTDEGVVVQTVELLR